MHRMSNAVFHTFLPFEKSGLILSKYLRKDFIISAILNLVIPFLFSSYPILCE